MLCKQRGCSPTHNKQPFFVFEIEQNQSTDDLRTCGMETKLPYASFPQSAISREKVVIMAPRQ